MSSFVPPMLAVPGELGDLGGAGWSCEFKWDGVRTIIVVGDGQTTLWSRNGNDVTASYPDLLLHETHPGNLVLDGEIVALDASGVPSFSLLQRRMHVRDDRRAAALCDEVPATLMVFDAISIDTTDLTSLPHHERRTRLQELELGHPRYAVPPAGDDAAMLLAIAEQRGLEGIVAKRVDRPYQPGVRSKDWRKIRLVREQDCVVVGWRPGRAGRAGRLGALLVATLDDGVLTYAGSVGSGLKEADLDAWHETLASEATSSSDVDARPADDTLMWTTPRHVVRVRYVEWTPEGRFRHPTYRGRRDDVGIEATSRTVP